VSQVNPTSSPRQLAVSVFLLVVIAVSIRPSLAQEKVPVPITGPVLIRDEIFHSSSLQRDMHYRMLLPSSYESGGRFPSLYLLHGVYGDYKNWDTRTKLDNYARDLNLAIVMPDAGNSWYTNSATVLRDKFEDYIVKDLISDVDEKYRTIHDGHARAIAGLSMGGYGAVKLGTKYPELFTFAGSLSGAFNGPTDLAKMRPGFRQNLMEVFGPEASHTRSENNISLLLKSPHQVPYPYFYVACGTSDFTLDANRGLIQELSAAKIPYEYHETPGAHTWDYWDRELRPLLKAVEVQFQGSHLRH
jgi:putative tributyrin esterase